ncbi:hypothetical protein M0804_008282 [Polistes exclamans]|nr:hypothetical protein M0804_008282 [Polistes exclamans]
MFGLYSAKYCVKSKEVVGNNKAFLSCGVSFIIACYKLQLTYTNILKFDMKANIDDQQPTVVSYVILLRVIPWGYDSRSQPTLPEKSKYGMGKT